MKTKTLPFLVLLGCFGCSPSHDNPGLSDVNLGPATSFDEASNGIHFKSGESRLIGRDFAFQGKTVRYLVPSLALFEVKSDTVIEGISGQNVDVSFWEFTKDSTLELHWKQLIAYQDSVATTYELQGGQPAPLLYGLLKGSALDTNVFLDRDIQLRYPLVAGKEWNLRLSDDPFYIETLQKKYIGREKVALGGAEYDCGKFEHYFLGGAVGRSWISSRGLLKAEVDYGKSEFRDEQDNIVDSAHTTEAYRLMQVNPSAAFLAAAKAAAKTRYLKTGF